MVETYTYYLLLGGNLSDTIRCFEDAIIELNQSGEVNLKSSVSKSKAWGFESDNEFKNQAISYKTELSPINLLEKTQLIENKLGRKKLNKKGYEDRVIDIDILFCGSLILESKKLTIPHPKLHLRSFTLDPLLEIAPNFTHPKLMKTIIQLSEDLGPHNN